MLFNIVEGIFVVVLIINYSSSPCAHPDSAASTTAVVNFLVLLSSTVGTIIGAFQLAVKQIESFLEFKPSDDLDEAGSGGDGGGGGDTGKGASNKEPIELTAVSFSSKQPPSTEHNSGGDFAALQSQVLANQHQLLQHHAINQSILAKLQQIEEHLHLVTPTQQAAAVPAPHLHTAPTSGDGYGQIQDD